MSARHVSIPVFGVLCAAPSVGNVLVDLPGVISAYVNPATEFAEIDFDEDRITIEELAQAIRGCGFRVGEPTVPEGVGVSSRDGSGSRGVR